MTHFQRNQEILDNLIPLPVNLPKIYLLGDTGAGKTTIIRQLLGTTSLRFPSVRRTRTTIAVTEYVLSKESKFRAAIVFKPAEEVHRYIQEILEDTILKAYRSFVSKKLKKEELVANLEESPDQRFRLRFMINEVERNTIATAIIDQLLPKISDWINQNFPNEKDDFDVLVELAIDEGLKVDVGQIQEKIVAVMQTAVQRLCDNHDTFLPESYTIEETDIQVFLKRLKPFLDAEEESISPVIERARVRGNISATWLPENLEVVLIDGEGIGHDIKEANKSSLSPRHLDFFYLSDAIILVEDSERPFIAGGKSALLTIARNGFLPKAILAFSKLDKIEGERHEQIAEVNKSLRNLLSALSEDEGISISKEQLDIRYLGKMDNETTDDQTKQEITDLLNAIKAKATEAKPKYIKPVYDFELLAPFLDKATSEFRSMWDRYLSNDFAYRKPWQTIKAFNYRMSWGQDEYKDMRPVEDLHTELITKLERYITSPTMWEQEVTTILQQVSVDRFKQEFSISLVQLIREILINQNEPYWRETAELRGTGSTKDRAISIKGLFHRTVPSMTDEHARRFKDAIKECFQKALTKIQ